MFWCMKPWEAKQCQSCANNPSNQLGKAKPREQNPSIRPDKNCRSYQQKLT